VQAEPAQLTLLQLAEHLRKYAAAHFGLYAERALYACFLGAMAASDFILLRGTDENRSPLLLCQAIAAAFGQKLALTTVQPRWSSAADLIGESEPTTKLYRETAFLRQVYAACYDESVCFSALDRVTVIPAEVYLSALLPALRLTHTEGTTLPRSISLADAAWPGDPLLLLEGALPYPDNLWLFGNIAAGDPTPGNHLRAAAMEFCLPVLPSKAYLVTLSKPVQLSAHELRERFAHAREVFELPGEALRHFRQMSQYLADHMDLSLGPTAETQLKRFCSVCLAFHKALRRLETVDPAALKYETPGLRRYLDDNIGKRELPLTMSILS
jgi:hypothetical protein